MRVVVLVCCAVAIAAAAASVYSPHRLDAALIVAVAMLACAQVVSMLVVSAPEEIEDAKLASLAQRIAKNAADLDRLSTRWRDQSQKLAELEQRLSARMPREPALPPAQTMPPAGSVQQGAATGHAQLHRQVAFRPAAGSPPAPEPVLCLEPVVRLTEGRTAYYKASLQLTGADARVQPVLSADIPLPPGAAAGADAARDLQLLREVLPVLARLRARRSATGIFVPLTAATLESRTRLEAYVAALQASPDEAAGIVLDLNASVLATLDETALRGLAWLANLGAAFCLTCRGAARCDVAALSELGFAFIDLSFDALSAESGRLSPEAERLMQAAAARNMTLIAAGVREHIRPGAISGVASLARGPAFAPPRAVRTQAEQVQQNRQVA